jgi:hypothetical protein
MSKQTHLRNLCIALLVVTAMLLGSNRNLPTVAEPAFAPLQQSGTVTLTPPASDFQGSPGGSALLQIQISNNTGVQLTGVTVQILPQTDYGSSGGQPNIRVLPGTSLGTLNNGDVRNISLFVNVPSNRPSSEVNPITLRVLDGSNQERAVGVYRLVLTPPTATLTTPTAIPTETPTERPLCEGGFDPFENNDNLGSAREIAINTSQRQAICTVGDEDWVFFSGLAGKVYTIDVPEMDAGLDLSLELFDEDERQLAFNDDFFSRDPAAPNPNDLRPRIQSFVAPVNAIYYVRIRDAGGRGGTNTGGEREYVVALVGESYGPTPTNIVALCDDLFEPDGLPEQATLMVINEAQPRHTLCPEGDADWVRFFATAGKRYVLFTDTRPYRPSANEGTDTSPGADTELLLTDRDGRTTLAFNDDIVGGNSFDSLIEFTVPVDGEYFAQVKNNGDVGSQFIRYDLYFLQCLPEQTDCGRTRAAPPQANVPAETATPAGPTLDPVFQTETANALTAQVVGPNEQTATADAILFATADAEFGQTLTAEALGTFDTFDQPAVGAVPSSAFDQFKQFRGPDGLLEGRVQGFADPLFATLWQRTDRAVAEQRQIRAWMWGPTWLMARAEPFAGAPGGARQVQYFEKGRMELNVARAGQRDGSVTSGLLVNEMIGGQVQTGPDEFQANDARTLPIAGDHDNFEAPTYTSFRRLLGVRAPDRTGQSVAQALNRAGTTYPYRGPALPEARLVHYVEQSGHNIPQAFWDYFNATGLVWENGGYVEQQLVDWQSTFGLPLSEPFWMYTTINGGERQVLVQPFERRVLVYTPNNPTGFSVEMSNVGVHYYEWRYGETPAR